MAPEPLRTPALRLLSAMLFLVALASPAHALRFMAYNILNYPGTTGATRDPSYRVILAPLSPDVLATEEMTSQAGVNEFLGSLNTMEPGQWAAATFVDGNDTDSGLFYKPGKVQFLGQWAFYPNPANQLRLIHVYRLKPVGYSSDAAEFRVYSMHLKASMGFEAQRLAEATGLRDSLNAMPPGTHALITGDFNFYTGLEPGVEVEVAGDERVRARGHGVQGIPQPRGLGEPLCLEAHRGLQVHGVDAELGGVGGIPHRLQPVDMNEAQLVRGVRVERPLPEELHLAGLVEEPRVGVVPVHERRGRPLARLHRVQAAEELVDARLRRHLLGGEHVGRERCQDDAIGGVARGPGGARVVEDVVGHEPERVRRAGERDQEEHGGKQAQGRRPERLGGHRDSSARVASRTAGATDRAGCRGSLVMGGCRDKV